MGDNNADSTNLEIYEDVVTDRNEYWINSETLEFSDISVVADNTDGDHSSNHSDLVSVYSEPENSLTVYVPSVSNNTPVSAPSKTSPLPNLISIQPEPTMAEYIPSVSVNAADVDVVSEPERTTTEDASSNVEGVAESDTESSTTEYMTPVPSNRADEAESESTTERVLANKSPLPDLIPIVNSEPNKSTSDSEDSITVEVPENTIDESTSVMKPRQTTSSPEVSLNYKERMSFMIPKPAETSSSHINSLTVSDQQVPENVADKSTKVRKCINIIYKHKKFKTLRMLRGSSRTPSPLDFKTSKTLPDLSPSKTTISPELKSSEAPHSPDLRITRTLPSTDLFSDNTKPSIMVRIPIVSESTAEQSTSKSSKRSSPEHIIIPYKNKQLKLLIGDLTGPPMHSAVSMSELNKTPSPSLVPDDSTKATSSDLISDELEPGSLNEVQNPTTPENAAESCRMSSSSEDSSYRHKKFDFTRHRISSYEKNANDSDSSDSSSKESDAYSADSEFSEFDDVLLKSDVAEFDIDSIPSDLTQRSNEQEIDDDEVMQVDDEECQPSTSNAVDEEPESEESTDNSDLFANPPQLYRDLDDIEHGLLAPSYDTILRSFIKVCQYEVSLQTDRDTGRYPPRDCIYCNDRNPMDDIVFQYSDQTESFELVNFRQAVDFQVHLDNTEPQYRPFLETVLQLAPPRNILHAQGTPQSVDICDLGGTSQSRHYRDADRTTESQSTGEMSHLDSQLESSLHSDSDLGVAPLDEYDPGRPNTIVCLSPITISDDSRENGAMDMLPQTSSQVVKRSGKIESLEIECGVCGGNSKKRKYTEISIYKSIKDVLVSKSVCQQKVKTEKETSEDSDGSDLDE